MKKYILILGLLVPTLTFADCDSNGKCIWDCSPDDKTNTCTATFEKGTLTISGTEMKNYTVPSTYTTGYFTSTAPWNDGHIEEITNVMIDPQIKNIGSFAFVGATNLTHISIPENTEVGARAFYHTGIQTIECSPDFKVASRGLFQYANLKDLSAFGGLETIEYAAFNGVFRDVNSPTSIILPDSVQYIDEYAFGGNAGLQNIVLGNQVTFIASNAFDSYISTIFCEDTTAGRCTALMEGNNEADKLQLYAKDIDTGYYVLTDADGHVITDSNGTPVYYANLDLMANKAACTSAANCAEILSSNGEPFKVGSKIYNSLDDFAKGNNVKFRIYTIEEANAVAGDKNRISIKYR